jgi:CRISPR-associated endoribonuclease Cas6
MSFHSNAPMFDLYPLRFRYVAGPAMPVLTANLLRGAFGSALKNASEADYQRFFTPKATGGPSGLADWPRPFVFRLNEAGVIGMNLFATREPVLETFTRAMARIHAITIEGVEGSELLRLPLTGAATATRLRVTFLTPTELKGADRPEFGVLLARLRDRISTLGAVWGQGPLAIDFKGFGERAARVSLTRCDVTQITAERISKGTGQRHAIGGFTGTAEYEGDLGEFLPYLEIARYTGVGRQTVWGKGEIAYETL